MGVSTTSNWFGEKFHENTSIIKSFFQTIRASIGTIIARRMLSKMYLATTLTLSLGLGLCSGKEETPRYLWKSCNDEDSFNLYNSNLEVPNAFENETIRMSDYSGQVLMVVNVASY